MRTLTVPDRASQGEVDVAVRIPAASTFMASRSARCAAWLLGTSIVTAALAMVVSHYGIPPIIEADYAYTFLAADRLHAGLGVTSIPPRAPLVPWEWHADWATLTQWPAGYPVLLCATRWLLRVGTSQAASALAILCSGVGTVAWFAWARRCVPRGALGTLLAAVVGLASISAANLINPSTDTAFLALTPLTLLLMPESFQRSLMRLFLVGCVAGLCCWIRYAAVALPAAIGLYLAFEWMIRRRCTWRSVAMFTAGAVLPVAVLVAFNRTAAAGISTQQQLNLGTSVGVHLDIATIVAAWQNFTRQTLYAHRQEASILFAIVIPAGGLAAWWFVGRRRPRTACSTSPMYLSFALVCVTLLLLVAASTLFRGKYDYAAQPRYCMPIRPLYFVLFVSPLLAIPWRIWRVAAAAPLVASGVWFVQQDLGRTLKRWAGTHALTTDYGRMARRFEPHSRELYAWLKQHRGDDLVVFSNFHEEIALETWIPACPSPADPRQLDEWLTRMGTVRGTRPSRVLFVLDPDNDYRSYYLPTPSETISRFGLTPEIACPQELRGMVFRFDPPVTS